MPAAADHKAASLLATHESPRLGWEEKSDSYFALRQHVQNLAIEMRTNKAPALKVMRVAPAARFSISMGSISFERSQKKKCKPAGHAASSAGFPFSPPLINIFKAEKTALCNFHCFSPEPKRKYLKQGYLCFCCWFANWMISFPKFCHFHSVPSTRGKYKNPY